MRAWGPGPAEASHGGSPVYADLSTLAVEAIERPAPSTARPGPPPVPTVADVVRAAEAVAPGGAVRLTLEQIAWTEDGPEHLASRGVAVLRWPDEAVVDWERFETPPDDARVVPEPAPGTGSRERWHLKGDTLTRWDHRTRAVSSSEAGDGGRGGDAVEEAWKLLEMSMLTLGFPGRSGQTLFKAEMSEWEFHPVPRTLGAPAGQRRLGLKRPEPAGMERRIRMEPPFSFRFGAHDVRLRGASWGFGFQGGMVIDAGLEVGLQIPPGFWDRLEPDAGGWFAWPQWSVVSSFFADDRTQRLTTKTYAVSPEPEPGSGRLLIASEPQRQTVWTRAPGKLRFDRIPLPHEPRSKRAMTIATTDRGLRQADNGKPGIITPGDSVMRGATNSLGAETGELGVFLSDDGSHWKLTGELPLDTVMRPVTMRHPVDATLRGFAVPRGARGIYSSSATVWLAADEDRLVGFSDGGSRRTLFKMTWCTSGPDVPESLFWIDRRVCGDWTY